MTGFCVNLAKGTSKDGVLSNAVPGSAVEVMHASTKAFVLVRVKRGHNPLRSVVVQKKASLFGHHILVREGIWHTVDENNSDEKNRGGPLRKKEGGC